MTTKPTLHSHTHCQVAQANAQTKTWQRVCLSHRTIDIENQIDQLVYKLYDLTEEEIEIVEGQ
jgi:hypothetical protein